MSDPVGNSVPLDVSVDAFSDVLELIHLRGETLTMVQAAGRTEVRHPATERVLHYVQQGSVDVLPRDGERLQLGPGDLVLLATGTAHRVRADDGSAWISGRFLVEEHVAAPLLAVLPPIIVLSGSEEGIEWLPIGAALLVAEIVDPSAGSRVMVSRLLDLLFIRTLRAWASGDGVGTDPGWLTAALDRPLGPALRAIHRRLEHPWSVDELAAVAAMSRAAFAARFTRLVGEPPSRYLTGLRLARAADLLLTTEEPVGAIGKAVGYVSEAAFSRAFARQYEVPPSAWRLAG